MGLKDFFIKKALKAQMKNLPKDQQELIMTLVEEHPELFQKMAEDLKTLTKQGKSQMQALMEVMKKYQTELQQALGPHLQNRGGGMRPMN